MARQPVRPRSAPVAAEPGLGVGGWLLRLTKWGLVAALLGLIALGVAVAVASYGPGIPKSPAPAKRCVSQPLPENGPTSDVAAASNGKIQHGLARPRRSPFGAPVVISHSPSKSASGDSFVVTGV